MALIAKTKNFLIEAHPQPEVGREDGGHIVVSPTAKVEDRTKLSAGLAKEMVLLTIIAGKAMKAGLAEQGIELGRINYQDNGNWKPELHIHLYGRAVNAKYHPFGHPIKSAWTAAEKIVQEPLNVEDIECVRKHMLLDANEPGFEEIRFDE